VEEWTPFITSAEQNLARQPAARAHKELLIPPRSVVTLIAP